MSFAFPQSALWPQPTDSSGHAVDDVAVKNAPASFSIFAILYAIFVLFHQCQWSYWKVTGWHIVLSLAAMLVILMPARVLPFACLVIIQLVTAFVELPWISNHWMLATCLCLTATGAMVYNLIKRRALTIGQWYLDFAPPMRWQLLTLYFFGVFHKLNSDFLNPELSCGVQHYINLTRVVPILPMASWAQHGAIWATLVVEGLLLALLAIPRMRIYGVLAAFLFHFALAINGFANFSSLMFAMILLFAPADFPERLKEKWDAHFAPLFRGRVRLHTWHALWWILLAMAGLATIGLIYYSLHAKPFPLDIVNEPWRFGRSKLSLLAHSLWKFYGVIVIVTFVWVAFSSSVVPLKRALRMTSPIFWIFPALLFLNGMAPYLGLKTDTSFTMFSNLRTEMGHENHLLIRKSANLTNNPTDMVTILYSTDSNAHRLVKANQKVSFFELRSYVSRKQAAGHAPFSLAFERAGEVHLLNDAYSDAGLTKPIPLWQRKLLFYRTVRLGSVNDCDH